jgi:single-stranded-DNA-specific exonuclease
MNTLSVSGKSWILKKYNQEDISFLKDNFFLDEITSKLLSIRKIRKEDIKSFLNPSIKNYLPNPNTLIDMEKATLRTVKSIDEKEKNWNFW